VCVSRPDDVTLPHSLIHRAVAAVCISDAPACCTTLLPRAVSCDCCLQELEELAEGGEVFKLVGPILVRQAVEDAKLDVDRRLEFIIGEMYVERSTAGLALAHIHTSTRTCTHTPHTATHTHTRTHTHAHTHTTHTATPTPSTPTPATPPSPSLQGHPLAPPPLFSLAAHDCLSR
jgi:hypothetical protein